MQTIKPALFAIATLSLFSTQAMAAACVISSNDDQLPIRMCQQNINIPPSLFNDSFCQPQIPDRSFDVDFTERCPDGAYGVCNGAKTPGVAYEQAIHYYSDADDAPILKAYCEDISDGRWETP
ncbi:MAG TPA: hypothetical protein VLO13_04165 [Halomonas sp.]|nr:hypothetical protein [Halomonas sp.]